MKEAAKAEKNDAAFQTFHFANEVEKIHAALYSTALEKLGKNEAWIITSALFAVIPLKRHHRTNARSAVLRAKASQKLPNVHSAFEKSSIRRWGDGMNSTFSLSPYPAIS